MTYQEFRAALKAAKVGQCVTYHTTLPGGSLALSRFLDPEMDRIANLAFALSDLGYAKLVQRRALTGTSYEIYPTRKLVKAGSAEEGPITEAERIAQENF